MGFGGISVGGIVAEPQDCSARRCSRASITCRTRTTWRTTRSRAAQPAHGAQLADELERIVALHDASTIAAVIVEPIAGSTGVLIPPQGYLKRLREICDKHGILLIFDEVITGFGRIGAPFAAQDFGVTPDLMTLAKGLTNGCVPMGAVLREQADLRRLHAGARTRIELFHGYTYSAHPIACAAGLATLDLYQHGGPARRAAKTLAKVWEDGAHSLRGLPHVIDIRNYGLILGLELESIPGKPGARAFEVFLKCFERGRAGASDRRHHRAVAAAHRRAGTDRADFRHARAGPARTIAPAGAPPRPGTAPRFRRGAARGCGAGAPAPCRPAPR